MLDGFQEAMDASMTPAVKLWVQWMTLIFIASIPFTIKHVQARWAVIALLLTGVGAVIVWNLTREPHLLGVVHIVVWGPLALYLWNSVLSKPARSKSKQYRLFFIWACLIVATIIISLLFDVRDIYLVLTGGR